MAAQQTRQRGRVKFFNSTKGYGFIIPDDPSGQGKTEGILLSSTRKIAINSHIYWYHHRHCFTTISNLNFRRRFCTPHRNIQQWRVQESGRGKWTKRDSPGLSARIWVLCVCGNRAKRYIKTVKSIYLLFFNNKRKRVCFCSLLRKCLVGGIWSSARAKRYASSQRVWTGWCSCTWRSIRWLHAKQVKRWNKIKKKSMSCLTFTAVLTIQGSRMAAAAARPIVGMLVRTNDESVLPRSIGRNDRLSLFCFRVIF